jgi:nucleoside-diphosphate-sugar epimerase
MKVLVTGGTGVVGGALVRELHRRGHGVRVLSRTAHEDGPWWPSDVEAFDGDVSDERSLRGAADGCQTIIHAAGIAAEHPPERTFQRVNIDGTRYVILEAERAGVDRVVYISSLGAERGQSAYHKSKLVAEDVVRAFTRDWVIVRPGAVYGPGDEHVSVLLRMVRSLPIVPTIGDGTQRFQPIWHEDLARAVATAAERPDFRCRVLEVAGPDVTSQNDLVARLRTLTGRAAPQAPLPEIVASWGIRALDALGVGAPVGEAQLQMLREGNVIAADHVNALGDVLGVAPTHLADGLARLVNEQPEQLPSEGTGTMRRRRYWVDLRGARFDADGLFEYLKEHFGALLPAAVSMAARSGPPSTAEAPIAVGQTLTLEIPVRGQVQVRVAEAGDRRLTMLTVAGHPIAGAVRFQTEPLADAVRFEIQAYARAASTVDELLLRAGGDWLQRASWMSMVQNVARAAGVPDAEVLAADDELNGDELDLVDRWASTLSATLVVPEDDVERA